jgi:hypothetical protein
MGPVQKAVEGASEFLASLRPIYQRNNCADSRCRANHLRCKAKAFVLRNIEELDYGVVEPLLKARPSGGNAAY